MGASTGCYFSKLFLTIMNTIFFIVGLGLMVIGMLAVWKAWNYRHIIGQTDLDPLGTIVCLLPVIIIAVGFLIAIFGLVGSCGAIKEKSCQLYTYATFMALFSFPGVAAGIIMLVWPEGPEFVLQKGLLNRLEQYKRTPEKLLTKAWEQLQSDFHCCGVANVTDGNLFPGRISEACCIEGDTCDTTNLNNIYETPCFDVIFADYNQNVFIFGICCIVLGVLDMMCVFAACCAAKKKSYDTSSY